MGYDLIGADPAVRTALLEVVCIVVLLLAAALLLIGVLAPGKNDTFRLLMAATAAAVITVGAAVIGYIGLAVILGLIAATLMLSGLWRCMPAAPATEDDR